MVYPLVSGLSVGALEGQSATLFSDVIGNSAKINPQLDLQMHLSIFYKDFRSSISSSISGGTIDADSFLIFESQSNGVDFQTGGGDSVNETTYEITNTGSKDATAKK